MTYSPLSRLVEKCEPRAIEQVSTHSKITLTKSYLQIEHYNFQHGFTCYFIKVTEELCVSLYPSSSVGLLLNLETDKLSSLSTLTSKLCNKLSTQFKHLSSVVSGITDHKQSCFSNLHGTRMVEFSILGSVFQIYKSFPEDQTF